MSQRIASCHCRALALACDGAPRKVSLCHCSDCQRRTGSAFSVAVFFDRAQVTRLRGVDRVHERPSASGFPVAFHFCPDCGSNLYWEPRRLPELIGVAIGGFEDPAFPAPEQAVWTQDRHAWLDHLPALPGFEANPPPRP